MVGSRSESLVLEHFNVKEDHVTVIDYRRRMFADVYFREGRAYCELCGEEDCEHIKYALSLSKLQKALERKGWTIRELVRITRRLAISVPNCLKK